MNRPVLVVMAAGMGSRYGGLKQVDPVGSHGQLIIDYSIYDARRAGFETVIFVIKSEIEDTFTMLIVTPVTFSRPKEPTRLKGMVVMTMKENLGDSNWAAMTTNTMNTAMAMAL